MEAAQGDRGRAEAIGSRVGVGAALLMGGVLMASAGSAPGLLVSIAAVTVGVGSFAWFAGARVGRRIEPRGVGAALGIGALGGLASLLVAAVTASLVGAIWSLWDRSGLSAHDAYSYLGRPAVAVLFYGAWFAVPLGALSGALIFLLLWLRRPSP